MPSVSVDSRAHFFSVRRSMFSTFHFDYKALDKSCDAVNVCRHTVSRDGLSFSPPACTSGRHEKNKTFFYRLLKFFFSSFSSKKSRKRTLKVNGGKKSKLPSYMLDVLRCFCCCLPWKHACRLKGRKNESSFPNDFVCVG